MTNRWLEKEEYERAVGNGISRDTLYRRVYQYGWDIEKAINTPARKYEDKSE
ncbi:hypothetical protein [Bacillus mycoides]